MPEGRRAGLARHGRVLALCAVIQAAVGWIATQAYLVENNNLAANGGWVVSKTRLEKGLMGAYSFLSGRQSLAGGGLHLDAWHGFQEVVTERSFAAPRAVRFDAALSRGAWLAVSFNRDGVEPYDALRLSRHRRLPSGFLRVEEDGRFLAFEPLAREPVASDERFRVRLDLEPGRVVARVDGETVGEWERPRRDLQRIGLRGGQRAAAIDNVEILGDGERFRDDFSGPADRHLLAAGVAAALVLLNLGLFVGLSRLVSADGRRLSFAFLMVSLTLLACVALVFAYARVSVEWYPGQRRVLEESEAFYRKGMEDRVVAELLERLTRLEVPRDGRILFVGSSQTWGAGARRDEDAFVSRLEARLNQPFDEPRFLCLNLGVSSARAAELLPLVRQVVPQIKPRLVVINLSSNDRASKGFAQVIGRMVQRARNAGAQPVLVLEANAPGAVDHGLRARHAELRALAAELGLPLIDLHGHLVPFENTGFLWWDKVHLTSYGQELAAAKLYDEIAPLLAAGG